MVTSLYLYLYLYMRSPIHGDFPHRRGWASGQGWFSWLPGPPGHYSYDYERTRVRRVSYNAARGPQRSTQRLGGGGLNGLRA